jgi:hypothetical protein
MFELRQGKVIVAVIELNQCLQGVYLLQLSSLVVYHL